MAAVIRFHLTGGASNSNGNASLGGDTSGIELSATAMNNLFDDVTPAEAVEGSAEYRAIDVKNVGDATAASVRFYMNPETTSPASQVDAGIEASPINSVVSIADETSAPPGVSFVHYDGMSRLSLPDIPSGSYCRVWLRWVVTAGAANTSNDSGAINVEYA